MRNETITLTAEQSATVAKWEGLLTGHEGETLTVDYVKRDGTMAVLTGIMTDLYGGTADKRVIRMETDKGPRSANLFNVFGVDYA